MAPRRVTVLALAWLAGAKGYADYKLGNLKYMLEVRGVSCNGCVSKEDWVAAVRQHVQLEKRPVVPELEAAYRTRIAYAKQAKQFRMSRDEFVAQLRSPEGSDLPEVDEDGAERAWRAYQDQLAGGTVEFIDESHARFTPPLTHRLAPYLSPRVAEAVEAASEAGRSVYRRLPAERRSQGEWVLSWLVQAGVLHALIALLVSILLLDMGRQRWHGRRRDNRAAAGVNGHGTSGVEARKAAGAEEGVER